MQKDSWTASPSALPQKAVHRSFPVDRWEIRRSLGRPTGSDARTLRCRRGLFVYKSKHCDLSTKPLDLAHY
jgi:hypothetical protein